MVGAGVGRPHGGMGVNRREWTQACKRFPVAPESSRVSPPHRPREDGLTRPADTSRSNIASALGLLSRRLSEPSPTRTLVVWTAADECQLARTLRQRSRFSSGSSNILVSLMATRSPSACLASPSELSASPGVGSQRERHAERDRRETRRENEFVYSTRNR